MDYQSFGTQVKRTTKKIFRIILWLIIIVGIATFSFLYWGVYERGSMAGKILRVSEKGMVFKTYEGKINLETFGALKDVSPIAESFDFSIEKNEKEVLQQLQEAALSGERVNLHYVKRYSRFPWRGDTRYFAVRVERTAKTK